MSPDTSVEPDARIVAAVLAGDSGAFGRLMERHRDAVYRIVLGQVGDASEALDLVQEVFVSAYRALKRYDPDRPLRAWLFAIAFNRCRDWRRRRVVRRFFTQALPLLGEALERPSPDPGADTVAADRQSLDKIWRAIADLPPGLSQPLLLTAVEGLSHGEAAMLLGVTAKAVEMRVARARALLRDARGDR